MARSLGLAAYLAYARRRGAPAGPAPATDRPAGCLVWAHAPDPGRADALAALARHLAAQRPGLGMMITTPEDAGTRRPLPERATGR